MTETGIEMQKEFKKLMNLIARYARKNKVPAGKENITRSQALILEFIYDNSKGDHKVYQKDIEKHFSIRRSTATESMKRLESQGLIVRKTSETDARLKELILTQKAIDCVKKGHSCIAELSDIICKGITKEEAQSIACAIKKMQNNLKEYTDANEQNS